jgi:hypothetical protein
MAIRRCPYCKAIIDEQDKYCNNCGTQLLFPEDEFAEEEIPGDKIIDDEEDEEEAEKEEPDEERELEGELEEEEELIEEEEVEKREERGAGEETGEEDKKEEKLDGLDEEEDAAKEKEEEAEEEDEELEISEETGDVPGPGSSAGEEAKEADSELEEELEEEEEAAADRPDDLAGPREPTGGEADAAASQEESDAWKFKPPGAEKKYEVVLEKDELVFKTKDIDQLTGTVDEGKKELESLLESHPDFAAEDTGVDTKEGLPLWARGIRETPAAVEPTDEGGERPARRREWTTDSGIGVPEKITKSASGLGDTGSQEIATRAEEREGVNEETEEASEAGERPRRTVSLSMKLKAKVVDWVFVTALWLISLAFTSQVLGVSLFRLIFGSTLPVLAFYAILLTLYFFLFLYFLGETLGDHYFTEDD